MKSEEATLERIVCSEDHGGSDSGVAQLVERPGKKLICRHVAGSSPAPAIIARLTRWRRKPRDDFCSEQGRPYTRWCMPVNLQWQ